MPADGSAAPVRLHPALSATQNASVLGALFTPDSSRVLFVSNLATPGTGELFSVPSDASAPPVRLNPPFSSGRAVSNFLASPLSDRVVYLADQLADEVHELFSVPVDGSGPAVRLSATMVTGGDVLGNFRISADGAAVAYAADELVDNRFELFGVPIDASAARVRLNGTLQGGSVADFEITADSQRVLYLARELGDSRAELRSAPLDGSSPSVRLSGPSTSNENVFAYVCAAGSAFYLRQTLQCVDTYCVAAIELFRVPIDGSAAPVTVATSAFGEEVTGVAFDVVSGRVLFRHDTATTELFSAPADTGAPVDRLNADLASGSSERDVTSFQITADGEWVLYLADEETNGLPELFRSKADGSGGRLRLSAPTSGNGVSFGPLSPDGEWAVYQAGIDTFTVRIDGSAPPNLVGTGLSQGTQFTPDSTRLLFHQHPLVWIAPLDGSGPPTVLVDNGPDGGLPNNQLPSGSVDPGSTRLVFVADASTDGVFELHSVLLDGSAAPVKLSDTLVAGGDVSFSRFLISPDGARVVYRADALVDERYELFSVPIDGSAPPVLLNGPLVTGGDVSAIAEQGAWGYLISPDSTRVVFVADATQNGRIELFSAPLDGSTPAVRLNANLPAGGDVMHPGVARAFEISPDSTRVAYCADQSVNDRFELFTVPIDGGAAAIRVSGALIPAGDVGFSPFEFTPDSTRILYVADALVDESPALFVAPVDASAAPRKLSVPDQVGRYDLSADGSVVAYVRASGSFLDVEIDLFFAQLDGGLHGDLGRLHPGAAVPLFAFHPDGQVIYLADRQPSIHELWATWLPRPRFRAR